MSVVLTSNQIQIKSSKLDERAGKYKERVKAHIAISFMALVCVRHLDYRVKRQYKKLSPEVIKNELLHSQCSILQDITTNKKYCIPSKTTRELKKIYQTVGKKIDSIPFEIK